MAKGRTGTENAEKRRVTLVSLAVAVFLIALKLFVGLSTGYLTLISEALHSSLDALVAIIAFFSIRYAEKPADAEHPYGHGKAGRKRVWVGCSRQPTPEKYDKIPNAFALRPAS